MKCYELKAGQRFRWAGHEWAALNGGGEEYRKVILRQPIEGVKLHRERVYQWLKQYFVPSLGEHAAELRPFRTPDGEEVLAGLVSLEKITNLVPATAVSPREAGLIWTSTYTVSGEPIGFHLLLREPEVMSARHSELAIQPVVLLKTDADLINEGPLW